MIMTARTGCLRVAGGSAIKIGEPGTPHTLNGSYGDFNKLPASSVRGPNYRHPEPIGQTRINQARRRKEEEATVQA